MDGMGGHGDGHDGMNHKDPMMPMPHDKKMDMHMTFFWGKDVNILFSDWPGGSLGMYILSIFFIFALAVTVEWISASRLVKTGGSNLVFSGLAQTGVHAVRMGLAYMVMLAIMSFNGGVFIAAIVGHALGFFIFGSRIFSRRGSEVEYQLPNQTTNNGSLNPAASKC